ncbi:MAG: 2-oxoglutarate dehydrogenase complex dihydrolipoyllysine-residue succinyltransferase [Thermomicrobiales bacterium]|nr:2-oxoglutarate dehydrogenase complex dihydrolipoyllysine-residue succinyltransferase [Thermomicrobiales bacterium]MCO5226549.1 2-oxoglutarate dehydrogenase complex dihydrolipoyllysine-residue succinyltransferase [Thermomicrobiales bacterium]
MAITVKVPALGESLVDAVVGTWLKAEGDSVSTGETILELETDKVNLDVTADQDGVLSKIIAQEGDVVEVGATLAEIEPGAAAPAPETGKQEQPTINENAAPEPEQQAAGSGPGVRATPVVQRLAEEHGIDLYSIKGTGPDGRITRDDVMMARSTAAAPAAPVAPAPPPSAVSAAPKQMPAAAQPQTSSKSAPVEVADNRTERVRLSRRRQTIAKRLVEAQQTAAMLTTFNEVDMTAIMDVRKRRKDAFKDAHGVNLGFMSFFTKAVVGALKAFPDVNSELDGDSLIVKKFYDIGIAVGVEEGLVVPVVRDADRKGFAQIEQTIVELAGRAREGKLGLEELQGGSFTITNGGVYGSLLSTPILNAPQVGILGMHTIQQRPVVVDGEIVIRPMMYIALSYDHRVVDGSTAVRFLVKVKQLLEDPETMLLEG